MNIRRFEGSAAFVFKGYGVLGDSLKAARFFDRSPIKEFDT
jgi:hypothetical protein